MIQYKNTPFLVFPAIYDVINLLFYTIEHMNQSVYNLYINYVLYFIYIQYTT